MKKWVHIHTSYQKNGDKDINPVLVDAVAKSDRSKNVCTWSDITPLNMSTIISSIFIMTYSKYFCKYFGAEIARIEMARQMPQDGFDHIKALIKGSYIRGKFVPKSTRMYNYAVRLKVPESMESSMHWGYLAWMFSECMEHRESNIGRKSVWRLEGIQ